MLLLSEILIEDLIFRLFRFMHIIDMLLSPSTVAANIKIQWYRRVIIGSHALLYGKNGITLIKEKPEKKYGLVGGKPEKVSSLMKADYNKYGDCATDVEMRYVLDLKGQKPGKELKGFETTEDFRYESLTYALNREFLEEVGMPISNATGITIDDECHFFLSVGTELTDYGVDIYMCYYTPIDRKENRSFWCNSATFCYNDIPKFIELGKIDKYVGRVLTDFYTRKEFRDYFEGGFCPTYSINFKYCDYGSVIYCNLFEEEYTVPYVNTRYQTNELFDASKLEDARQEIHDSFCDKDHMFEECRVMSFDPNEKCV